jgi:hypothetical protein
MSRSSRGINVENSSWKENMCADELANRGYKLFMMFVTNYNQIRKRFNL